MRNSRRNTGWRRGEEGGAPCCWSRYSPAACERDHEGAGVHAVAYGEPMQEISLKGCSLWGEPQLVQRRMGEGSDCGEEL